MTVSFDLKVHNLGNSDLKVPIVCLGEPLAMQQTCNIGRLIKAMPMSMSTAVAGIGRSAAAAPDAATGLLTTMNLRPGGSALINKLSLIRYALCRYYDIWRAEHGGGVICHHGLCPQSGGQLL